MTGAGRISGPKAINYVPGTYTIKAMGVKGRDIPFLETSGNAAWTYGRLIDIVELYAISFFQDPFSLHPPAARHVYHFG
jgi:hypothetical protein